MSPESRGFGRVGVGQSRLLCTLAPLSPRQHSWLGYVCLRGAPPPRTEAALECHQDMASFCSLTKWLLQKAVMCRFPKCRERTTSQILQGSFYLT